ncbi:hypothetical protein GALMADRAFT_138538 [Galerina marginata CBS 339.88]|uniref:F-box domain-containing protein n=1 Tax=Galerina marginata (strain CBS 339.88) TaxID=685588 RepID=A0A067T2S5_GALM3|nr:hypothetical protein GALMADRAFT_138538 [Galerina marginata CBS 339.88]
MASATLYTLPVELQALILKFQFTLSRRLSYLVRFLAHRSGRDPWDGPILFEWIEWDPHSPSLFPYNSASVCKLWRDILAAIPECWTRVVFDVAKDPAPFIDVFLWSNALTDIEVFVFNSSEIPDIAQESHRNLEYDRVSRIVQALVPHIHRCKSVTIDINYSSCLPFPTIFFRHDLPNIENLSLISRVDDIIPGNHPSTVVENTDPPLAMSFPKLKVLSLTGFWFMYLALTAKSPDWFSQVKFAQFRSLHVSQFAFLEIGHYTMKNFVLCLSKFTGCTSYDLRDLSLSYAFNIVDVNFEEEAFEIKGNIHFQSVSHDFLSHFYAISSIPQYQDLSISFTACQIPRLPEFLPNESLVLTNIDGRSIRNILRVWDGYSLEIRSCPSFNDTFITWLGTELDHKVKWSELPIKVFRLQRLMSLRIEDCSNFTSARLCAFVEARNDAAFPQRCDHPLNWLKVQGRVPALPDQNKALFLQNARMTEVDWQTVDENGETEKFTTHPMVQQNLDMLYVSVLGPRSFDVLMLLVFHII